MIFDKLFNKPAWKNKNNHVRISAINDSLSASNPEDKNILVKLCEQDDSELVRRTALIKLKSFGVYLEQSHTNSNEKVQSFAKHEVESIIHGTHEVVLTDAEKLNYLNTLENKSAIEKWLTHEVHPMVYSKLYEKLNKPHLLALLFKKTTCTEIQHYLISSTDNVSVLQKIEKHAIDSSVLDLLTNKITTLREAEERPLILKKSIQLVLAQLLALKDTSDYEVMLHKKTSYEERWSLLLNEFNLLKNDEQTTFKNKYKDIQRQIEQLFFDKAEDYKQIKATQELANIQKNQQENYSQTLKQYYENLTTCIYENKTVEPLAHEQKLIKVKQDILGSLLSEGDKTSLNDQVEMQLNMLLNLSDIAESVSDATRLISKLSQLSPPQKLSELNEKHEIYQAWQLDWKSVLKQSYGVLPQSINDSYYKISQTWDLSVKPLFQEQKSTLGKVKKKISDYKRLVNDGKFTPSFNLYKQIDKLYNLLSAKQKKQLESDFNDVSIKYKELVDLEQYIATPRKQALVAEISLLAETPLEDLNEQAEKVKACRARWNTLGHAEESLEEELNKNFNLACEKAFSYCRTFYQEQEKLRAENTIKRQQFILNANNELSILVESINTKEKVNQKSVDKNNWKNLSYKLKQLKSAWNSMGEIEREKYIPLNNEFKALIAPVHKILAAHYNSNASLKSEIINKTQMALASENIFKAVEDVKVLQQSWKAIGFAGPSKENNLWKTFKQLTDQIFDKRILQQKQEKQDFIALTEAFNTEIFALEERDSNDINTLKEQVRDAEALLTKVIESKPFINECKVKLNKLISSSQAKTSSLLREKAKQETLAVFELLDLYAQGTINNTELLAHTLYDSLSEPWKKTLVSVTKLSSISCRSVKTLELEIYAEVSSPKEFSQQRLQAQLDMMQSRVSVSEADLDKLLKDWLLIGQLSKVDIPLIARIKPIYCN